MTFGETAQEMLKLVRVARRARHPQIVRAATG
jgi:hypothetical protein